MGDWIEIYNLSEIDKVDFIGWVFIDCSVCVIEKNFEVAVGYWFELFEFEFVSKSFVVFVCDEMVFCIVYCDCDNVFDVFV